MRCPKCGYLAPVRNNTTTDDNEVFRRRRCRHCGHTFYTIEFEVEDNDLLVKSWAESLKKEKEK